MMSFLRSKLVPVASAAWSAWCLVCLRNSLPQNQDIERLRQIDQECLTNFLRYAYTGLDPRYGVHRKYDLVQASYSRFNAMMVVDLNEMLLKRNKFHDEYLHSSIKTLDIESRIKLLMRTGDQQACKSMLSPNIQQHY